MQININVKVKTGKKSEIEVSAYCTSVNEKILEFKGSSKKISSQKIARWIEEELKRVLKKYSQNEDEK